MKTKNAFKHTITGIVLIIFSVFAVITVFGISSSAQTNDSDSFVSDFESYRTCCAEGEDYSYIYLETEQFCFPNNENISVSYYVNSEYNVVDVNYTQTGFASVSLSLDSTDSKRINVVAALANNADSHNVTIEATLSSGEVISGNLFAIKNENGTFISQYSEDSAYYKYFKYAKDQNLITQYDYEDLIGEFSRRGSVEYVTVIPPASGIQANIPATASTIDTYIEGTLQWTDDNSQSHLLRRVKVEIYDDEAVGAQLLGTTHTDNYGHFSFGFENADRIWDFDNGGYDIFIRIYAGDSNAKVINPTTGDDYYIETPTILQDVETGSTIIANYNYPMTTDTYKALQISQATLTARDYAWAMMGQIPEAITVRYPYSDENNDSCYYQPSLKRITITGEVGLNTSNPYAYASWDVIMHEYGHHIQYQLGITDSPGGTHEIAENHIDNLKYTKDEAIKLAWAESWPTVFGMMAQEYYSAHLNNIFGINDGTYDAYNISSPFPIEYNYYSLFGDACEASIISVLWDIFDSQNDTNDTISLSHLEYWEITTSGQRKTFSDFIQDFYAEYPEYIDDLGANLTYYQMASGIPTLVSPVSSITQTDPPVFMWTMQGGSDLCYNNNFSLIVYNGLGQEIFRTTPSMSTRYEFTQAEWNNILYSYGTTFTLAVAAKQMLEPITGEYISAQSEPIAKPAFENLSGELNLSSVDKYVETTVNLQPGQYIDYVVSFGTSGKKFIQTFGQDQTRIILYNQSGVSLGSNYNSGYLSNALYFDYCSGSYTHIIRVRFNDSNMGGTIRLAIFSAEEKTGASTNPATFEGAITGYTSDTGVVVNKNLKQRYMNVFRFTSTVDGTYTIQLSTSVQGSIYVIDPSTNQCTTISANGYNPSVTVELEADIPYLILYSAYDLNEITIEISASVTVTRI